MPWIPIAIAASVSDLKLLSSGRLSLTKYLAITLAGVSGAGQLFAKGPLRGVATASRNPVAPWNVVYGRARVGGAMVYLNSFGDDDKYLDMIFVLACHPCQSVDALLFDQHPIQIDKTYSSAYGAPVNTSFGPLQQDITIRDIRRAGSVITVCLLNDIPLLKDGDQVKITNSHGGGILDSYRWTGKFPVTIIGRGIASPNIGGATAALIFTYLCSGDNNPAHVGPVDNEGGVETAWADYGRKVYMETMLGTQTLGQTFYGMTHGTPNDGDGSSLIQNSANPWTADCSLVGHTAVFLRLHYNDKIFANGLPQISFLVHGKNDIYDPRTSPPTYAYTENAALCIADYLHHPVWGFRAAYGTEIPLPPLIAAANVCDEAVALAEPPLDPPVTEPRYACNGQFFLTSKRGEVLQNLLTACGGRLTYTGGQFAIWPASWAGVSASITGTSIYSLATAGFRWKPVVSVSELFNGVKGTYISPVNAWQSSDFPRYAQDATHGYSWGASPQHDLNLDNDGGERRWLDVQLPFTISCPAAQRLAKIELLRRRQQGAGTFPLNMAAFQFSPLDVIAMDLPFFAWTAKSLEIQAARLMVNKQADGVTLLGTELDVQETDSSVYAWATGEELSAAGFQQVITPDTMTPKPPTDFLLSSTNNEIMATWTAPADGYVLNGGHIELRYRLVQSPSGLWFSLAKMDPSVTTATITGLIAGSSYDVEIRSVNAAGIPSAWVVGTPLASSPPTPGPITAQPPAIWEPAYEPPMAGDALFTAPGFGVAQTYSFSDAGTPLVALDVYGFPPAGGLGLVFKVRRELVSGIFAQVAASVATVDGTHGTIAFGGSGGSTNQFVGRIISKLANAVENLGVRIPIQDFVVTANDTSGNFTVMPDPAAAGCAAVDLFTLRTAPTDADASSVTDGLWNNLYNPGLTVNGNRGNLVLIIGGKGKGQSPQTVTSNTGTKVNVSPGWDVIPDATSIIVLVEAVPQVVLAADPTALSDALIGSLPVDNYARTVVRVEGYTAYRAAAGPIEGVPFREVYLWGSQGTEVVTS